MIISTAWAFSSPKSLWHLQKQILIKSASTSPVQYLPSSSIRIGIATRRSSFYWIDSRTTFTSNHHRLWWTRQYSTSSSSNEENNNKKKRVVFLGTPDVAATTLRTIYENSLLDDSSYNLVAVVTQPPKRRGRKKGLTPSPVGIVAEELGIDILCPEKVSCDFVFHIYL